MNNVNTRFNLDSVNNLSEAAKAARESAQPIILTENDSEELVIMSYETYKNLQLEMEIYFKIKEAEEEEEINNIMYSSEEFLKAAYSAIEGKA